jgi:hypothetical protein
LTNNVPPYICNLTYPNRPLVDITNFPTLIYIS